MILLFKLLSQALGFSSFLSLIYEKCWLTFRHKWSKEPDNEYGLFFSDFSLIIIVAHWPFEGSSFWGVREIRKDRKKQIWMKDIKKPKRHLMEQKYVSTFDCICLPFCPSMRFYGFSKFDNERVSIATKNDLKISC